MGNHLYNPCSREFSSQESLSLGIIIYSIRIFVKFGLKYCCYKMLLRGVRSKQSRKMSPGTEHFKKCGSRRIQSSLNRHRQKQLTNLSFASVSHCPKSSDKSVLIQTYIFTASVTLEIGKCYALLLHFLLMTDFLPFHYLSLHLFLSCNILNQERISFLQMPSA